MARYMPFYTTAFVEYKGFGRRRRRSRWPTSSPVDVGLWWSSAPGIYIRERIWSSMGGAPGSEGPTP